MKTNCCKLTGKWFLLTQMCAVFVVNEVLLFLLCGCFLLSAVITWMMSKSMLALLLVISVANWVRHWDWASMSFQSIYTGWELWGILLAGLRMPGYHTLGSHCMILRETVSSCYIKETHKFNLDKIMFITWLYKYSYCFSVPCRVQKAALTSHYNMEIRNYLSTICCLLIFHVDINKQIICEQWPNKEQ